MALPATCLAELVILGAQVVTMRAGQPRAEAFAVAEHRLLRVGTEAEVRPCIGPKTHVVDLAGAVVMPGFIDAHAHPAEAGMEAGLVNLAAARSLGEAVKIAEGWRASHPKTAWIAGGGWDAVVFADVAPRGALDEAFGAVPVYFSSVDGHSAWVNTAALRAGGLIAAPPPRGGQVDVDARGEPTGVIRETATDAVVGAMPASSAAAVDEGIVVALAELSKYGVTSVIEAASDESMLAGWRRAERAGRLSARLFAAIPVELGEGRAAVRRIARLAKRYHSDRLSVNAIKLFLDGVVETRTARMVAPYVGGGFGPIQFEDAELDEVFDAADDAHLQVHAHAIGDAAVRQALDAEARRALRRGSRDRRTLVAHLEFVAAVDAPRFRELGVIADLQPLWAYPDPYVTELTMPAIGEERTAAAYPFGTLHAAGAKLAAGSDWSVTTLNPWPAVEVAVTRADPDVPGDVLGTNEGISLMAILEAYTVGGAHAVFADASLGQISPGFYADFIVLDRDPWAIPEVQLSEVEVKQTWVGGECVRR